MGRLRCEKSTGLDGFLGGYVIWEDDKDWSANGIPKNAAEKIVRLWNAEEDALEQGKEAQDG